MRYLAKRKNVLIPLVACILSGLVIYAYRQPLSWVLWKQFHFEMLATALNNTDPDLAFEIGNFYFQGKQYDVKKAEQFIKRAITLNDGVPGTHYQLARVYFIESDFRHALLEINKEFGISPYFYQSYYVRGLIYGYDSQYDKAIADFKSYLTYNPTSWAAHNDLAWVYFSKGDFAEAETVVRDGLRLVPRNPWLLNTLGVVLLNKGRHIEAREVLEEAARIANAMTPDDWGTAYPGNNPSVYAAGFSAMKASIERNLELVKSGSG